MWPTARPPARSRCRVPRADDGRLTSAWECVCVCVCVASWSVATAPPQQTSCVISDLRHLPHAHTQNTHTRTRTRTQWRSVAERLLYLWRVLFFSTSFFSLFLSWKIFFTHSDKPSPSILTWHHTWRTIHCVPCLASSVGPPDDSKCDRPNLSKLTDHFAFFFCHFIPLANSNKRKTTNLSFTLISSAAAARPPLPSCTSLPSLLQWF